MVLSLLFVFFVWIKSKYFGIGTIPAFDLCLIPMTLVWLCFLALYQSDMMPRKHAAITIAASYNTVLLYNQVLIRWLEVTDRDSMLLICRLMSGFMWGDHVRALAFQLPWIMLKTQTIPHANDPGSYNEMWDIYLLGNLPANGFPYTYVAYVVLRGVLCQAVLRTLKALKSFRNKFVSGFCIMFQRIFVTRSDDFLKISVITLDSSHSRFPRN